MLSEVPFELKLCNCKLLPFFSVLRPPFPRLPSLSRSGTPVVSPRDTRVGEVAPVCLCLRGASPYKGPLVELVVGSSMVCFAKSQLNFTR